MSRWVVCAALACAAVLGVAAPVHAANIGGTCWGVHKGEVVQVHCKTKKPLSQAQVNRMLNGGWDVYWAKKSDNGVFSVPLPKYLRGQHVTVTARYTSLATPMWLFELHGFDPDTPRFATRTAQFTARSALTVAMPTSDYAGCFSIAVTVKGPTGRAYRYFVDGKGYSFADASNGYTDITVTR